MTKNTSASRKEVLQLDEDRVVLEGRDAKHMQEIITGSQFKDDRVHCYCAYA